jgi:hypothetical protein
MDNILSEFPEREDLELWFREQGNSEVPEVNAHIHSPYSFSSFDELRQAFEMARKENVKVLGINDFNTTMGYPEFYSLSREYKVFPLFNIEFMGLMKEEQKNGTRINDPANPGRIYFSGKGLDFPVRQKKLHSDRIQGIIERSHLQVKAMIDRLNEHLAGLETGLELDFNEIQRKYAMNLVRERHLARALRVMVFDRFVTAGDRNDFFRELYGRHEPAADINNNADIENEIRNRLLKSGGVAFVEEDSGAFLDIDEILSIIAGAGGIPCYPVLLDDPKGRFTEFEADMGSLYKELISLNITCIELIPGRNDLIILKSFVNFFREKGFVVLLGTEHNTPSLDPIKVSARGGFELDDELRLASYHGACVIAAHQYMRAKGEEGYDYSGKETGNTSPVTERVNINAGSGKTEAVPPDAGVLGNMKINRRRFEELGKAVIHRYLY